MSNSARRAQARAAPARGGRTMMGALRSRPALGYLLRIGGSAAILAVIFRLLPVDAVFDAFARIPPVVFVAVLLLFIVAHVLAAMKWWVLLDRRIPLFRAVRAHFSGLASNLCLPGAVGGDAVRAGMAYAEMKNGAAVFAVAAADRLLDTVALLVLSLFGLALSVRDGGNAGATLEVAGILVALVAAAVLGLRVLPHLWTVMPSLPGRAVAEKVLGAFADLARRPLRLAGALAASITIQLFLVMLAWWLADAAGADVALGHWIFAWPLAKLVAVLPVSLNGLGMREAVLAGILAPLGADAALVVGAGLAWQVVLFATGALGAVFLLLSPTARSPGAPNP